MTNHTRAQTRVAIGAWKKTPNGIYLGHEREPDMLIVWHWFDEYELNHRRAVPEIQKYYKSRTLREVVAAVSAGRSREAPEMHPTISYSLVTYSTETEKAE